MSSNTYQILFIFCDRCLLSFFALLVLIGSTYHVIVHDHVTSVLESLTRVTAESKAEPNNVYEQVVSEEDQVTTTHMTAIDEKCVGAGEGDIQYELPANKKDSVSIGNGVGNGHTPGAESKTKASKITKIVIEKDRPKISESGGRKLGIYYVQDN